MRVALASDLHLEFGTISLDNTNNADVLILSGDICVVKDINDKDAANTVGENKKSAQVHEFFQECCARFPHVIYILGNHEHYHGDFTLSIPRLREHLGYLNNLYILDKETVKIEDTTFIGGTLWTDMNNHDALTLYHMTSMMNDFRIINNSSRQTHFRDKDGNFHTRTARFSPEDAVEDHDKMKEFIRTIIEGKHSDKFVVVGHHAPSKQSTKPRYKDDTIMNGGYSSDLSEFILDHPQIKLWTHGHTHDKFDYMIGSTRILCNPRGYIGYEDCADNFALEFVDV